MSDALSVALAGTLAVEVPIVAAFYPGQRLAMAIACVVASSVTGIVVNDKLTIPRARRRRFRALLAHCKKEGLAAMVKEQPGLRAELAGFVAYVHMVQPDLAETLKAQVLALEPSSAA